MKIGLIKETKIPVDNRVALSPSQVAKLNKEYPDHKIVVQESDIRAFTNEEYRKAGVDVVSDLSSCDVLFGIKEAQIESLIPGKHYFFFGHIAKFQEYNKPLIKAMIKKKITFSDYEYLIDDNNQRVCAFGWWAGVVGVYYTLRGYGLKTKSYSLPKPNIRSSLDQLLNELKTIQLPPVKVLITGGGRVSTGAQYLLRSIGAIEVDEATYISQTSVNQLTYCVARIPQLVKHKDGKAFEYAEFKQHPLEFESNFMRWAYVTDILITAHFWGTNDPVYLNQEDYVNPKMRIRMIGDITCDIMGSIKSTLRASTHSEPYYDYNPSTGREEEAFSSEKNITVMAVDTCPNALPLDTSEYFGEMLIEHVFIPLFNNETSSTLEKSTIIKDGFLTNRFAYLKNFAED